MIIFLKITNIALLFLLLWVISKIFNNYIILFCFYYYFLVCGVVAKIKAKDAKKYILLGLFISFRFPIGGLHKLVKAAFF